MGERVGKTFSSRGSRSDRLDREGHSAAEEILGLVEKTGVGVSLTPRGGIGGDVHIRR